MHTVMMTCCILHNMIVEVVEDESDEGLNNDFLFEGTLTRQDARSVPNTHSLHKTMSALECSTTHYRCRDDLVEHLWNFYGDQSE